MEVRRLMATVFTIEGPESFTLQARETRPLIFSLIDARTDKNTQVMGTGNPNRWKLRCFLPTKEFPAQVEGATGVKKDRVRGEGRGRERQPDPRE
ncbi:hypothetical protein E2C01_050680 [Portunus trituberculatus]|uniref:Uncharacterized protein n=1 Tax=Portunus trituberculatus TaxID=210409 RepID=A0A5B7GH13_PORTR|nr:hypothetical protein [Portunus trituberculatus]